MIPLSNMDTSTASISKQDTIVVTSERQQSSTNITDEALTPNLDNNNELKDGPPTKSRLSPIASTKTIASFAETERIENNNNHQHSYHNHDQSKSNIKLKRCRHGRIVIKDLSKKKLTTLTNDREEIVTDQFQEKNDSMKSGDPVQASGENDLTKNFTELLPNKDITLQSSSSTSPTLIGDKLNINSPSKRMPPTKNIDDQPKKDLRLTNDNNRIHKQADSSIRRCKSIRSSSRSLSRDRSIDRHSIRSRSCTPSRTRRNRARSPYRSSRTRSSSRSRSSPQRRNYSPSPRRRGSPSPRRRRSSSIHRRRSPSPRRRRSPSPRKRRSPSPRRRSRSPISRKRRRRRTRRGGRNRSPRRRERSTSYKDRRSSPRGDRRSTRTRSRSSSSNSLDSDLASKIRRRGSKSPIRSHYSGEKRYPRDSIFERVAKKKSFGDNLPRTPLENFRDERKLRTDTLDSGVVDNMNSSKQLTQVELNTNSKADNAQTPVTRVVQPMVVETTKSISKISPKAPNTSPRESSSARSPLTPSNDSISSDIYDPEGPIIPISPGDSPPLSPIDDIAYAKPIIRPNSDKNGDDDVPSSAVQLNQQEKYLQKLNRQERVIEEVKIALRPYYQNRSIDKEQYKDILRRAVPKICHSKKGEINPIKIRSLVGAYVRKMKQHRS